MKSNYEIARRRVALKKEYYSQFLGYCLVLVVGIGVFEYGPGSLMAIRMWFDWIILVLGLSLVIRYFYIFGLPEFITDIANIFFDWEEKAIEREMKRMEISSKEQDESLDLDELNSRPMPQKNEEPQDDGDLVRMPSR